MVNLNSDICKSWYLFAAQFTFSEMLFIAFDKILLTFGYFFWLFWAIFTKWGSCFGSRNNLQLLSFSECCSRTAQQWQNKGAKIQIISAETLSNFDFGRNFVLSLVWKKAQKQLKTKAQLFFLFCLRSKCGRNYLNFPAPF